jgi:hypothetical protein
MRQFVRVDLGSDPGCGLRGGAAFDVMQLDTAAMRGGKAIVFTT